MFFPTGNTTQGHTIVCLCCCDDLPYHEAETSSAEEILESICEWMQENAYCTESWQVENYIQKCGYPDFSMQESEGGMASLNTTPGMGAVTPPTGPGTNANFYNAAKQGSGDKFTSLTVGTPSAQNKKGKKTKSRTIQNFSDFVKSMKKLQEK
jgi:hypothetical protein